MVCTNPYIPVYLEMGGTRSYQILTGSEVVEVLHKSYKHVQYRRISIIQ